MKITRTSSFGRLLRKDAVLSAPPTKLRMRTAARWAEFHGLVLETSSSEYPSPVFLQKSV
jgi:hypothetical protein